MDGSEEFLHEMLKPFGSVSKIQFDHSPDGIDRKIGIRFLNKPRVYTLYYYDPNKNAMTMKINGLSGNGILDDDDELLLSPNREAMIFKTSYDIGNNGGDNDNNKGQKINNIKCHKCGKDKSVSEGFYTTSEWKVIYCAQCAAQLAEDQLNVYYKERNIPQYQHNPRHKWLGLPPNDIQKRKTALVVFASQRQASKCAYVRTRIAYKGSFATHFHHYSKVKKEIVLSESDQTITIKNDDDDKGGKDNKTSPSKSTSSKSSSSSQQSPLKNNNNQQNRNRNNRNKNNQRNQQNRNYNNNQRRRGSNYNRRYNRNNNQYNNNNQQQHQYGNYAQQQAQYYQGQQPPNNQQSNKPKLKGPGLYRQSSAPTSH